MADVFHEPELQNLLRTALEKNYDVRIAAQRILEQAAQVRITRAQQFPTLNIGGTGIGAELPSSFSNIISGPLVAGSFNLSAAWNPDFWGLYRRQSEAARAQLLAQTWAQRAVRLTLVQQVAALYLQLRALDRELDIARQTVKIRQDSVDLTRTLERGGAVPLSDVRQAEQLLFQATSQVPQLEQSIQQDENGLRVLLGENPGPVAHTDQGALAPPPQDVPVGLPSQLLERRPDIQQAEQQLIAANAQIGVARAQFFPQLSLSASAGVGGDSFANIFDWSSKTIYGIGSLAQPIFAGGKLKGQLQLSEEMEKQMVLTYQQTIVGAFRRCVELVDCSEKATLGTRAAGAVGSRRAGRDPARPAALSGRCNRLPGSVDDGFGAVFGPVEPGECSTERSACVSAALQRAWWWLAIVAGQPPNPPLFPGRI